MLKKTLNVGLIGSGVMSKAHSIAYSMLPQIFDNEFQIQKKTIAARTKQSARAAKERLGYESCTDSWEQVVEDKDIDIIDICTPNDLHKPIVLGAARNNKHIVCEKPLALDFEDARLMYDAVSRAPIRHCVAFNYRMAPAVLEAKRMIDNGLLGDLYHFRGCYLQDFAIDGTFPLVWRFRKGRAGSGALGDIGSHIIDFARYLCGEPRRVMAMLKTFIRERPEPDSDASPKGKRGEVDVDDAVSMMLTFDHQALGTIEASRFFNGRKNHLSFEISGSLGSIYFDWERNNELLFYSARQDQHAQGFKTIVVGPAQPYGGILWPIPGLGMAYLETTTVLLQRFLEGIAGKRNDNPDFYDGCKAAQVVEAVLTSSQRGEWVEIEKW